MRFGAIVLLLVLSAQAVRADGGVLRLSQERDGVRVCVFTPSAPSVGMLDVSVLVQDAKGRVRLGVPVEIRAVHSETDRVIRAYATAELATNKLLQAAHLNFNRPGRWRISVVVETVEFAFELAVGNAAATWWPLVPWVSWPFAVIALFLGRIFLSRREPHLSQRV